MPTVFENYTACLETEEQRVELSLWDTSGKTAGPRCPLPTPTGLLQLLALRNYFPLCWGGPCMMLAGKLTEGDLKIPLVGMSRGAE